MALILVATAGATNANSYATLAEANAYHEAHLYGTVWEDGDDQQVPALIWATRLLDQLVDWQGYKTTLTQALRWPRSAVLDRDGQAYFDPNVIPLFLKQATAELARLLIAEDRTADRSFGIASLVADTVEVVFDKYDVKPVLPQSVLDMIAPYGQAGGPGNMIAKLVRV